MKFQIDTIEKTIFFEQEIELGELVEFLKETFPNDSWKAYRLVPKTFIDLNIPIIISNPPYPTYPVFPSYPIVYGSSHQDHRTDCGDNNGSISINANSVHDFLN